MGFLSEIVFICGIQPLSSGWLSCLSGRVWRSYLSWSLVGRAPGPGLGCRRQAGMVLSWHCRVTLVIPGSWARPWTLVACGELLGVGWKQRDGGGFLHRREVSGCICRVHLHWVALLGLFLEAWHLAESVCLRTHASLKQELKYNFLLVKNCPCEAWKGQRKPFCFLIFLLLLLLNCRKIPAHAVATQWRWVAGCVEMVVVSVVCVQSQFFLLEGAGFFVLVHYPALFCQD